MNISIEESIVQVDKFFPGKGKNSAPICSVTCIYTYCIINM